MRKEDFNCPQLCKKTELQQAGDWQERESLRGARVFPSKNAVTKGGERWEATIGFHPIPLSPGQEPPTSVLENSFQARNVWGVGKKREQQVETLKLGSNHPRAKGVIEYPPKWAQLLIHDTAQKETYLQDFNFLPQQ